MTTGSFTRVTIALPTKDLRRAFEFYRTGLGLSLSREGEDGAMPEPVEFSLSDSTHLMLVPTGGFVHVLGVARVASADMSECVIGVSLTERSEVDAWVERACAAGATIQVTPQQQAWGYSATIRDPDGHVWMPVAGWR